MRSGEHRARFLGIHSRTAGHRGHPAEPLVGGNEHLNLPELAKIKRDGKLKRIQGAQAFRDTVLNQESPRAVKVALVDWRGDEEVLECDIGAESATGDLQRLLIDLASPGLDRQYGLYSTIER